MFDIGRVHTEQAVSVLLLGGGSLGMEVGAGWISVLPFLFKERRAHSRLLYRPLNFARD